MTINVLPKEVTPIEDIMTVFFDQASGQYKNTAKDVRANDLGPSYLTTFSNITTLTPPANRMGNLAVDTKGTASTADDVLVYTPNANASGLEIWTYVMTDTLGRTSTGSLAVQLNGPALDLAENSTRTGVQADLQVVPTDALGNPLAMAAAGQKFWLTVYTRDPRTAANNDPGIKSATADLLYDSKLITPTTGTIVRSDFTQPISQVAYSQIGQFQTGDSTVPGIVNEAGGLNNPPPGTPEYIYESGEMARYNPATPTLNRYVLFRIEVQANPNVNAFTNFYVAPADIIPPNDTLVIDPVTNTPIKVANSATNYVQFTGFQLGTGAIPGPLPGGEGEGYFTNSVVPGDANGDRKVDMTDIMGLVYEWNRFSTPVPVWQLQTGFYGRTNAMTRFVDMDADGMLSVTDILHTVYRAGKHGAFGSSGANGEGESSTNSSSTQSTVDADAADAIFGAGGL